MGFNKRERERGYLIYIYVCVFCFTLLTSHAIGMRRKKSSSTGASNVCIIELSYFSQYLFLCRCKCFVGSIYIEHQVTKVLMNESHPLPFFILWDFYHSVECVPLGGALLPLHPLQTSPREQQKSYPYIYIILCVVNIVVIV
jgi:hypothetical protein